MPAVLMSIEDALGLPRLHGQPVLPLLATGKPVPPPAPIADAPLVNDQGALLFGLPALGGMIPHVNPSIMDYNNPGSSQPQRHQQLSRPTLDQTMSVTHSRSGLAQESNGQEQRPDLTPGLRGVTVTTGYGTTVHSSGNAQMPSLANLDQGVRSVVMGAPGSGSPLPANVMADSQSAVRKSLPDRQSGPLTVNVHAGRTHGEGQGLARAVHVRG